MEERCELVVVGAGLAALHLVSRLPDNMLRSTVVVDNSGAWLSSWSRCERLAVPLLRTPVTQHPHPSPLDLQAYAEKRGRKEELVPVVKGFAPVPSVPLFIDFCRKKVVGRLPARLQAPLKGTVVRIEGAPGAGSGGDQAEEEEEGDATGCRVHLASGQVLTARAVVYTPANTRPILPAWLRQLAAQPQAAGTAVGDVGEPQPAGSVTGHLLSQPQTQPLPPGIATSDCVDLRSAELAGRHVVVVGGGMSAGLLAAGAAERGARVTLVCRRLLKPQAFETEVGWWGNRELNSYRQLDGVVLRVKACRRARGQGSVHLPVWRRLTWQAAAGTLTVLEGWEVASVQQSGQRRGEQHPEQQQGQQQEEAVADGVRWQLTLRQREQEAQAKKDVGGRTIFQQAVAATALPTAEAGKTVAPAAVDKVAATAAAAEQTSASGGGADSSSGSGPRPPATPPMMLAQHAQQDRHQQHQNPEQQQQVEADLVWVACGSAYDASKDGVLSQLQQEYPTLLAAGYPLLDDEHLCWPGVPVYLLGRGSMLSVGPCAGGLPGMRLAADRVVRSLKRLDYAGPPVWQEAAQQLPARLHQQLAAAAVMLPQPPGTGAPAAGTAAAAASANGASGGGSQLAVALAAAQEAVRGAGLPLEEEGCIYQDPKPKVLVSRPPNLIDVSDLDPALPRHKLEQYKFTDDDFELCVICQLPEAVPLDQVRVLFMDQGLEMWAVGQAAAYHLHLPRLYGRVVVKKCKVKVNQKSRKVYLTLHKESDAEWRFLKG